MSQILSIITRPYFDMHDSILFGYQHVIFLTNLAFYKKPLRSLNVLTISVNAFDRYKRKGKFHDFAQK